MRAGRVETDADELGRSEHDGPELFNHALLGSYPGSDPLVIEEQSGQLEHTALDLCSNARSGAVVEVQQSDGHFVAQPVGERVEERSSRNSTMGDHDAVVDPISDGDEDVNASSCPGVLG